MLRVAYVILGAKDKSRTEVVQFHQSYSYETLYKAFDRPTEPKGVKLPRLRAIRGVERR